MMMQERYCFFEGKTERFVFEGLGLLPPSQKKRVERNNDEQNNEESSTVTRQAAQEDIGGKSKINDRVRKTLGPDITDNQKVRCLILRDLDSHDDETPASIKQSVVDCFKALFRERGFDDQGVNFKPHEQFSNVFLFEITAPDLKVALHIAEYKYSEQFIKSTIDDYILDLALRAETVQSLIKRKQNIRIKEFIEEIAGDSEEAKINQLANTIIKKVLEEIPQLLRENGFPPLKEAKQYLQYYSAITQEPKSPAVISKDVIKCASDEAKQTVLASLFATIQFLSE